MKESSFQKLEERVHQAVDTIRRLREENSTLSARRAELEESLSGLEKDNNDLRKQLDTVQSSSVDRKELESRKREIEGRVEGLLELFSELDD